MAPKPKIDLEALFAGLDEKIGQRLDQFEARISDLEHPKDVKAPNEAIDSPLRVLPVETTTPISVKPPEPPKSPVPPEYRSLVDTILNSKFDIRIEHFTDAPAFQFIVVCPRDYSQLSEEAWRMFHEDLRPKVLTLAEGINGVRAWAERVYESFPPDIQARITADRVMQFQTV